MEETRLACDKYEVQVGAAGFLNAQRLRALIRLMRYAGLRISDAVNLSTARITDDKLFLYTQKTGTAVYTVLPPFVVEELAGTPQVTDKLYFWSGNGELETAVLLGHFTIKVTERHYAPWIQKRQQRLEADLRAMWSNDEQGTKRYSRKTGVLTRQGLRP